MGVNALIVEMNGEKASMQVGDIVKRKSPDDMPQGTVWVENPSLHLTAIYLRQEMRRPAAEAEAEARAERIKELNEELTADFRKGSYIFAIQKEEKGIPLVKMKDGQLFQPAFTDILEFQKFNRDNKLRPVVVEAERCLPYWRLSRRHYFKCAGSKPSFDCKPSGGSETGSTCG